MPLWAQNPLLICLNVFVLSVRMFMCYLFNNCNTVCRLHTGFKMLNLPKCIFVRVPFLLKIAKTPSIAISQ